MFDDNDVSLSSFKYSVEFYRKGTTNLLERNAKGKVDVEENVD